jgi:sporulation protein YlmC with PRC-barrel domain
MRMDELMGKTVIGANAQVLGEVSDVEFNLSTWKITNICIKLIDNVIEPLGFKKPRLRGSVIVEMPVEPIKAVGDVVSIDKSLEELRSIIKRR